jgi:DNA-binding NtrC family response regulator
LFLDEVGDMNARAQAKVLRALQEGEIERVGDSKTLRVDVRVLAATNKDLPAEVSAGSFREDLYFRLNVVPIHVRPLRERRGDVAKLARHFLALYAAENELPARALQAAAVRALEERPWPGNVRELRNVIDRLAILAEGPEITEHDVREHAGAGSPGSAPGRATSGPATGLETVRAVGGLVEARRAFERQCIESCLDATAGNVSQAARLLNIERSNLHKKMQFYGLEARPARPGRPIEPSEEEEP